VDFAGGLLSSDGGSLLLAETERRRRILGRLASCFVNHRDPELLEHEVQSLVSRRVFGLALGEVSRSPPTSFWSHLKSVGCLVRD
jgi:hypothetical protein